VDRYGAGRVLFFSAWLVILLLIASVWSLVFNPAPGASSGHWDDALDRLSIKRWSSCGKA